MKRSHVSINVTFYIFGTSKKVLYNCDYGFSVRLAYGTQKNQIKSIPSIDVISHVTFLIKNDARFLAQHYWFDYRTQRFDTLQYRLPTILFNWVCVCVFPCLYVDYTCHLSTILLYIIDRPFCQFIVNVDLCLYNHLSTYRCISIVAVPLFLSLFLVHLTTIFITKDYEPNRLFAFWIERRGKKKMNTNMWAFLCVAHAKNTLIFFCLFSVSIDTRLLDHCTLILAFVEHCHHIDPLRDQSFGNQNQFVYLRIVRFCSMIPCFSIHIDHIPLWVCVCLCVFVRIRIYDPLEIPSCTQTFSICFLYEKKSIREFIENAIIPNRIISL